MQSGINHLDQLARVIISLSPRLVWETQLNFQVWYKTLKYREKSWRIVTKKRLRRFSALLKKFHVESRMRRGWWLRSNNKSKWLSKNVSEMSEIIGAITRLFTEISRKVICFLIPDFLSHPHTVGHKLLLCCWNIFLLIWTKSLLIWTIHICSYILLVLWSVTWTLLVVKFYCSLFPCELRDFRGNHKVKQLWKKVFHAACINIFLSMVFVVKDKSNERASNTFAEIERKRFRDRLNWFFGLWLSCVNDFVVIIGIIILLQ